MHDRLASQAEFRVGEEDDSNKERMQGEAGKFLLVSLRGRMVSVYVVEK